MIQIEEGSTNVYADLGKPDAEGMLVKAQLASQIGKIIKSRRMNQEQAAKALGLTQPKVSMMLRGQFRGISESKMLDCLTRLGRNVQIVIAPAGNAAKPGRISVTSTRGGAWVNRQTETGRITATVKSPGNPRLKGHRAKPVIGGSKAG